MRIYCFGINLIFVTVRSVFWPGWYITRSHIREYGATEGCPECKWIEAGRSMPHNNECRMRIRARMLQNEDGREGLKKEEQSQDRHLKKAVMRSAEEDPELRHAEKEHKRKLVEIENDDGSRGSDAEREVKRRNQDDQPDQSMDHTSDKVRGTKRKTEDKGEHEEAKRQDSMIASCLREEELTRRDTQKAVMTRGRYYLGSVEESEDQMFQLRRTTSKSWQKPGMTLTVKNLNQKL